jgi:selenocysteine-specific elongation factor
VRAALGFLGLTPWSERRLAALAGVPIGAIEASLGLLADALVELPVGPRRTVRVLGEFAADLEDRVLRAIGRLHASHPRQSAIPRVHLAAELPDLANEALVSGLLDRLKRQGRIVADGRTVALKGHEAKLSQGERRLKQELAETIRAGGFSPPDASELAASAGPRAAVVPDLLALLRDEQRLAEINPGLYLDADVDAELRRKVRDRLADGSTMTMSELRDLLGTTRKYSVPIGEYLDRIGLTRRDGDVRRLGAAAETPAAAPS